MTQIDRLPAIPLIVNDPYFSVWLPGDTLNAAASIHWSGAPKELRGMLVIDGTEHCFLGKSSKKGMQTLSLRVTPTRTESVLEAGGVEIKVTFWSPALPDDPDALSTPITFVDFSLRSADEKKHEVLLQLTASDTLCFDGPVHKPLTGGAFDMGDLHVRYRGQAQQHILGNSGDHVTIDWGYLYMAARETVEENGFGLEYSAAFSLLPGVSQESRCMLGYDDIASINYFGVCCRAWYQRNGKTFVEALREFDARHDVLFAACEALDQKVLSEAERIGGEDYARIAAAAWRHTFGAHKLIATPKGEMALLSKENDSNGCIGTVDVSYPSSPLFLKFCPELVNALCRPVLEFAQLPVWEFDFAPHDVGRYPYATGQVYGARSAPNGWTPPPYYLYPAGTNVYDFRSQMPVEECGNMLILLEAALSFGADEGLARQYLPTLEKWVGYLDAYGEDPGEQLCTDDFAGHLEHNVNLSAKAMVGIACYARLLKRFSRDEEAQKWQSRAETLAQSWLKHAATQHGTSLTFDGQGWSMKYNLVWDRVLRLQLLPEDFYREETESYLSRINEFGLPLDSRADYTKSDWILWCASMTRDASVFSRMVAPVAHYLRTTNTRVPFSDWYDTKTGAYVYFIARSVQGGLYMPMLAQDPVPFCIIPETVG